MLRTFSEKPDLNEESSQATPVGALALRLDSEFVLPKKFSDQDPGSGGLEAVIRYTAICNCFDLELIKSMQLIKRLSLSRFYMLRFGPQ